MLVLLLIKRVPNPFTSLLNCIKKFNVLEHKKEDKKFPTNYLNKIYTRQRRNRVLKKLNIGR